MKIIQIPIDKIDLSDNNPRKTKAEQEKTLDLACSIKQVGLLQPIGVRAVVDSDRYSIEYGERRYLACSHLQMKTIPAVVVSDKHNSTLVGLTENIQRERMTEMDVMESVGKLANDGFSATKIAHALGMTQNRIKLYMHMLPAYHLLKNRVEKLDMDDLRNAAKVPNLIEDFITEFGEDEVIRNHVFGQFIRERRFDLDSPPFDPLRVDIPDTLGSCEGCFYNSGAHGDMFRSHIDRRYCSNAECYVQKVEHSEHELIARCYHYAIPIVTNGQELSKRMQESIESFELEVESHTDWNQYDDNDYVDIDWDDEREPGKNGFHQTDAQIADLGYQRVLFITRWNREILWAKRVVHEADPDSDDNPVKGGEITLAQPIKSGRKKIKSVPVDHAAIETIKALNEDVKKRQDKVERNNELEKEKSMQAVMEKFDDILANATKSKISEAVWNVSGSDYHPHYIAHAIYESLDWHSQKRAKQYIKGDGEEPFNIWLYANEGAKEVLDILLYFWYRMKASKEQFESTESRAYYEISQKLVPDWVAQIESTNREVYEKRNKSQEEKIGDNVAKLTDILG